MRVEGCDTSPSRRARLGPSLGSTPGGAVGAGGCASPGRASAQGGPTPGRCGEGAQRVWASSRRLLMNYHASLSRDARLLCGPARWQSGGGLCSSFRLCRPLTVHTVGAVGVDDGSGVDECVGRTGDQASTGREVLFLRRRSATVLSPFTGQRAWQSDGQECLSSRLCRPLAREASLCVG